MIFSAPAFTWIGQVRKVCARLGQGDHVGCSDGHQRLQFPVANSVHFIVKAGRLRQARCRAGKAADPLGQGCSACQPPNPSLTLHFFEGLQCPSTLIRPPLPSPAEPSLEAAPPVTVSVAIAAPAAPGVPEKRRHIRLTSHAGGFGALPLQWGAATAAERGPVVGTTTKRAHRNVIGTHSGSYSVYRALAVASGALNRAAQGRPHQHRADRRHRPLSAMGRARPHRLARPVGRAGGRRVRRRAGGRLRHPPDHRHHQGARDPARGDRRAAGRPARGRRRDPHSRRRGHRHQGRDRAGVVPARSGEALRLLRDRPAPRAVRRNRRHVPRAGDALRPRGVPAADRRADALHLRQPARPGQPGGRAHRAHPRRVQRLRRVRLRHLHLPARTSRTPSKNASAARSAAASGSSPIRARKAARSAK